MEARGSRWRSVAKWAIYLTVVMGPLLLAQIYGVVPSFLFYTILVGWVAYVVAAVLVAMGRRAGFYSSLALSILVLAASLPQPEHYSFAMNGDVLPAVTFIVGDALQFVVIVSVLLSMRR